MEAVKSQNSKILKYILVIFLGSILLTISSKIKIPFYPVPMTMQTFVVLLLGIMLGSKIGLLTVSLYLLEGIYGLPVFGVLNKFSRNMQEKAKKNGYDLIFTKKMLLEVFVML